MSTKEKTTSLNFKVSDEIWWFQCKNRITDGYGSRNIMPETIELVHDVVTDIREDILICWHGTHKREEIWGKSRFEAWERLKNEIEKWGALDGKS